MAQTFSKEHPQEAPKNLDVDDGLGKREKVRWSALLRIVKTGKFKSSGNGMYNWYKRENPTAEQDKMDKKKALTHRLEWAEGKFKALDTKRMQIRIWRKSSTQTFTYRTYGATVRAFGGWKDPAAIEGANTACLRCLVMGAPWAIKHVQSEMINFAILEMS